MIPWIYPRIIVHRCGGALAPENTLAGLGIAARMGCAAAEFDAMLSADGVPVLVHDETLGRTTACEGRVDGLVAAELLTLDAGRKHHAAYAGERLPSLEAALERCAALGLAANVEIKPALGADSATGEAVARVVDRILSRRSGLSVLLSSFSASALAAARLATPRVARALLVGAIPGDWRDRVRKCDGFALHASAAELAADQVSEVRQSGLPLACYTVNDPARARELFALGVVAVFTDRPDLFPINTADRAP